MLSKYQFGPSMNVELPRFGLGNGPADELLATAVAYAQKYNVALVFLYEDVLVMVTAETDPGLLERDWLLAYYGAVQQQSIGPKPQLDLPIRLAVCYAVICDTTDHDSIRGEIKKHLALLDDAVPVFV